MLKLATSHLEGAVQLHEGLAKARLEHLVAAGDWGAFANEPVFFIDGEPVLFEQDTWEKGGGNYVFTYKRKRLPYNFTMQLKAFVIALLYIDAKQYSASTISSYLSDLKKISTYLLKVGMNSFEGLGIEHLQEAFAEKETIPDSTLPAFNALLRVKECMPFDMDFNETVTPSKLKLPPSETVQYPVIPYRIYLAALDEFSQDVEYWYQHRLEIQNAVDTILGWCQAIKQTSIQSLRTGRFAASSILTQRGDKKFISALEKRGIPLVDQLEHPEWLTVFDQVKPSFLSSYGLPKGMMSEVLFPEIRIGKRVFSNDRDLKAFLVELDIKSKYLCLALSGMRAHEFAKLTPESGAQTLVIGPAQREVPVFTTYTTKITETTQAKNRIFVTTTTGHKAFGLLKAIHTNYRRYFEAESQTKWFAHLLRTFYPKPITKTCGVTKSIGKRFAGLLSTSAALTHEDLTMLSRSDPTNKSFKEGEPWHLTPHQLRRSLVYYLVGFELAHFTQLKQQYDHFSLAMTMYYGANADRFTTFYREMARERDEQQSELMADIYQRIANGERIAGGQGKLLREMGAHYFQQEDYQRKCSKAYWQEQLKKKRGELRVHAVAPGIICTNRACQARIEIDLSECVDCSYDFIESAAYAEQARVAAMGRIAWMERHDEWFPDALTRDLLKIRCAEKILSDMGISYDPYQPPEGMSNIIIATTFDTAEVDA